MQDDKQEEADINKQHIASALPLKDSAAFISRLKPEEYEVYIWLLQAYSIAWISETLGLKSRKVKSLASNVYKTFEVKNQRELIKYFVSLKKYESKPPHNLEDFAYAMASYTDNCAKRTAEDLIRK